MAYLPDGDKLVSAGEGRVISVWDALTGEKLSAGDAHAMGMIWQVVDDAELASSVQALAHKLAAMPVTALAATRRAFDMSQELTLEEALGLEARMQRELGRGADFAEGVAAFQQKRAPAFKDR